MEPLRIQSLKPTRRAMLTGMVLAALSPIACLGRFARKSGESTKAVHNGLVRCGWQNTVTYGPDTSRGGAVVPGLIGRVYLFDHEVKYTYVGDGCLSIRLYDATPRGNADPVLTDVVDIDPETLRKLVTTDFMGPGYTVFFPWFNYKPEVTHAYIAIEYISPTRGTFTHQSGTFTVDHSETKERMKKGMPAYKLEMKPIS